MHGGEGRLGAPGVDPRHLAAGEILNQRKMRAAHFALRQTDQIESVARLFEIHRDAIRDVVDLAQGAD